MNNHKGILLLIEDEGSLQASLTSHFTKQGYEVQPSSSSSDAFEKLKVGSFQPAAVAYDLHAPSEMSGIEFAAKLKASRPDLPVIFIMSEDSIHGDFPSLGELEKRYMKIVLEKTKGRKERAAKILGINRRTLYRKEREFGWVAEEQSEGSSGESSAIEEPGAKPAGGRDPEISH